ncbi:MAG: 23S rRNA (uracil(1939)-C(5))-methyltransferase RlmD [Clostridiales bacterium]|nr:23S rRNA (uracil(1939)-C(5))-methyltransferase RlmD [Clostridiales bacterium]
MDCPVFKKCGGCEYAGLDYPQQLKTKEKKVRDLLSSLCRVHPIVGADPCCFYRNKVHWAYGFDGKRVLAGRYAEGSHRIIENDNCLLEDQECQKIQKTIRSLAESFKIQAYDERTKRGLLRRVLVRKGMATGEVMVVLVLVSPVLPGKKAFIKNLLEKHPSVKTVLINVNTRTDSMILGGKTINEFGRGFIWDELCGVRFKISPESFFQINHDQTEKLYALAIEAADLHDGDKVLDAYCGIGTIGLCAAASAHSFGDGSKCTETSEAGRGILLTGVEVNRAAVSDARENARVNEGKAKFVAADATEYMMDAASRGEKYDVVFLDPPRAGTTEEFIRACEALGPKRIVYVSCDPVTLARDLRIFTKHGYAPKYAVPLDMMPLTGHIETMVLLLPQGR